MWRNIFHSHCETLDMISMFSETMNYRVTLYFVYEYVKI